jgi:Cd2+/Zn2+-exporting ATPase
VLVKGGAPLEALAHIQTFAFDKTGTLTEGQPTLAHVQAVDCTLPDSQSCPACDDLLALAAAVERRSEHPLARAVVTAAQTQSLLHRYPAARQVASLAGQGVRGEVNGQAVTVGSHALFDTQYPHSPALCDSVRALESRGQTAMLVEDSQRVRGVIGVADRVRPASRAALEELHRLHPRPHTVMLTGDNPIVAQAIGAAVGVDQVRASLLPRINSMRSARSKPSMAARRWSATASTTPRRWRPPRSESRWAGRARPRRWRPPTWC